MPVFRYLGCSRIALTLSLSKTTKLSTLQWNSSLISWKLLHSNNPQLLTKHQTINTAMNVGRKYETIMTLTIMMRLCQDYCSSMNQICIAAIRKIHLCLIRICHFTNLNQMNKQNHKKNYYHQITLPLSSLYYKIS